MKRVNQVLLAVCLVLGIVVLDQATKLWAADVLKQAGTIPLIRDVFHLTYAENTGAAFSLLSGGRWFFLLLTPLVLGLLIYFLASGTIGGRLGRIAVLMLLGGALGNFIDRLRLGYVIDMFDFRLINFAVFNVADSFVTVGGGLLILWYLFFEHRGKRKDGDGQAAD